MGPGSPPSALALPDASQHHDGSKRHFSKLTLMGINQRAPNDPSCRLTRRNNVGAEHDSFSIIQDCTLSPLLSCLQTWLLHDAQAKLVTPQVPVFDIEFADDIVLVVRAQQHGAHERPSVWFLKKLPSIFCVSNLNLDKNELN